jgi:hypothetical protein
MRWIRLARRCTDGSIKPNQNRFVGTGANVVSKDIAFHLVSPVSVSSNVVEAFSSAPRAKKRESAFFF